MDISFHIPTSNTQFSGDENRPPAQVKFVCVFVISCPLIFSVFVISCLLIVIVVLIERLHFDLGFPRQDCVTD